MFDVDIGLDREPVAQGLGIIHQTEEAIKGVDAHRGAWGVAIADQNRQPANLINLFAQIADVFSGQRHFWHKRNSGVAIGAVAAIA